MFRNLVKVGISTATTLRKRQKIPSHPILKVTLSINSCLCLRPTRGFPTTFVVAVAEDQLNFDGQRVSLKLPKLPKLPNPKPAFNPEPMPWKLFLSANHQRGRRNNQPVKCLAENVYVSDVKKLCPGFWAPIGVVAFLLQLVCFQACDKPLPKGPADVPIPYILNNSKIAFAVLPPSEMVEIIFKTRNDMVRQKFTSSVAPRKSITGYNMV